MPDLLLENISQIRSGVGGYNQRALPSICISDCMGTGHTSLAHTTFTREENKLGHFISPFRAARISSVLGYAPTLITFPCTTTIGRASICFSRTSFITSGLFKKAVGL